MGYGFYRDEVQLPHKPLPLAVFLVVEEALRVAWQRLKALENSRIDIATAAEDEVTHDFYEVIFDEVFNRGLVDGFDTGTFTVVTREKKLRNYNGDHLDKMPDLLVGIAGRTELDFHRRSQDWLFIECKPVDAEHTVGVHYGAKGIARFIRGDYAWTMTSALMVGYASPGYTIDPKLFEMLENRGGKEFAIVEMPKRCPSPFGGDGGEPVYSTKHRRTFHYVENGMAAPPILLRHLWLRRY